MSDGQLVERRIERELRESLAGFRAVMLHGPRQSGKSTLAKKLASNLGLHYTTLDDEAELGAVRVDAQQFLAERGAPLAIDEVQRGGQRLVLAIKLAVDQSNDRGQFLLTGSTNFLTVPTLSESLTGRIHIVSLLPFAAGEILGGRNNLIDRIFLDGDLTGPSTASALERRQYFDLIIAGGFPEVQELSPSNRSRWFSTYISTVIEREIKVSADIRKTDELRRLAEYVAANTSHEIDAVKAANALGVDRRTVREFMRWLEITFVVARIPAWSRNQTSKLVKRPKYVFVDTGLAAHILNKDADALSRLNEPATGQLVESFVANEIAKQLTWSETQGGLYHFRDRNGAEVDLILERSDGQIAAIEVKSTRTPGEADFKWIKHLRQKLDATGDSFKYGIVFHMGAHRLRFGDRLLALPISDIWS